MENNEVIPINSIGYQNVTIRRKNKEKLFVETAVEEGEKYLLIEASYTPLSKRLRLAKENGTADKAVRAKNPSTEVTQ